MKANKSNVDQKKAKWLLGGSGIALTTALLTQIQYAESKNDVVPPLRDEWISNGEYLDLDREQQTLLTLDWTPFVEESTSNSTQVADRQTKAT